MLADARAHATLPTSDVEALRPFYEEVLGFTPHAIRASAVVYRAGEGSLFAISRSAGAASGSHTRVAFAVVDLEATVAELRRRGVVFEEYESPRTEDGIARMPVGRGAWFRDPAGNLLAVAQFDEPF
jgi:catechol 2,3-dioxygenase-like lactoylglutathione lyase family enzyme